MSVVRNRVEVLHGVNLDMLGKRPAEHYGSLTFDQLEQKIEADARALGLVVRFFQSNHEGEFVEHLHSLDGLADAVILNPGAWTHYSWAIRDALEICGLPAVEVHLSDITAREEFRKHSVVSDLCLQTVKGRGPDGYRDALETLAKELDS